MGGSLDPHRCALGPQPGLMRLAYAALKEHWDRRIRQAGKGIEAVKAELARLNRKAEALMTEKTKSLVPAHGGTRRDFAEMYRTAMQFLSSSWKLWASEALEHKRTVLKLVCPERVKYCRESGCRTARIALPFSVLEGLKTPIGGNGGAEGILSAPRRGRGCGCSLSALPLRCLRAWWSRGESNP